MPNHDLIVVLGSQPDPETWKFPDQIYDCLDRSRELLDAGDAPYIATSGKWGIALDALGIQQPFRECDRMADYLIDKGVPDEEILREGDSKDAISNFYFLKTEILIPREMRRLILVAAEFRVERLKFLSQQILGDEYTVDFDPIASEVGVTYNESNTLPVQREFLEPMKPGDHTWLADKFYDDPMYDYWDRHNSAMAEQS